MRFVLICEIIALFVIQVLIALLRWRGVAITEKLRAFTLATLTSLLIGSFVLYIINPENLFSLTLKDWLSAIGLALLSWVFLYPFSRWLYNQFFQQ
jgi:hypothetical protein